MVKEYLIEFAQPRSTPDREDRDVELLEDRDVVIAERPSYIDSERAESVDSEHEADGKLVDV